MPGLFGIALSGGRETLAPLAETLAEAHRHHPDHHALPPHAEDGLAAGLVLRRADLGGGVWEGPVGLRVWLDGEAFGEDGPMTVGEAAERLVRGPEPEVLDGAFAAVVHDPARGRLRFITDPYGLKYLYLRAGDAPAWCGELSAFFRLPGPPPETNPECLGQILRNGHPLGRTTWLRGVELLGPGELVEFDLRARTWSRRRYFRFEDADAHPRAKRDWNEAVAEAGRLFHRAVTRRATGPARLGITLSGGLDSRALLAASPPEAAPSTVTFGIPGCDDAVLAARAAAVRGAPNVFLPLGSDKWLEERVPLVPLTDGHLNILDLHGMESQPAIEGCMDVCLHGYLGDALLGGSYLERKEFPFEEQYLHRGRRFILQALHFAGTRLVYRLPFLDLALANAVFSLPRSWLRNSRLYRAMLLRDYPEYYASIPWEKTGLPISAPPWREFARRNAERIRRRLPWAAPRRGYTDYANWLREGSVPGFLASHLGSEALLHRFADRRETESLLRAHARGEDRSAALGRRLTAELWLRHAETLRQGRNG